VDPPFLEDAVPVAERSHGDVADMAVGDMAPYRPRVPLAGGPMAGLADDVQFAGSRRNGARTTARRHSHGQRPASVAGHLTTTRS
jgi:hypothetical protein